MSSQNSDFFLELVDYFVNQANGLQSQAREASIFDNRGDIGTVREDILFNFLQNHIPTRCNLIKGGFVFDSMGNKSRQIDLIVCNDQTFQFKKSGDNNKSKSFNCIEGCYAVISVKSKLDKTGLIEAVENLESVSNIKRIKVNPFVSNAQELIRQIPQRIIFGFAGDAIETVNKNLAEYYSTRKVKEYSPDFIMVNNEYYFSRAGILGIKVADSDERVLYGEYAKYNKSNSKYVGASALLELISRIVTVSAFSPYMEIDFQAYSDRIDQAILTLHKKDGVP